MNAASLPEPVRTFVEASNAGDTEAFVAAFTPDARLDDWGRVYQGHDGVRDWNETDNIGVQSRFEVVSVDASSTPDVVTATLRVSGNGYNGTGAMVFRLRDGLIADLKIG
jgi:ketosteroid isomerase-like protein